MHGIRRARPSSSSRAASVSSSEYTLIRVRRRPLISYLPAILALQSAPSVHGFATLEPERRTVRVWHRAPILPPAPARMQSCWAQLFFFERMLGSIGNSYGRRKVHGPCWSLGPCGGPNNHGGGSILPAGLKPLHHPSTRAAKGLLAHLALT